MLQLYNGDHESPNWNHRSVHTFDQGTHWGALQPSWRRACPRHVVVTSPLLSPNFAILRGRRHGDPFASFHHCSSSASPTTLRMSVSSKKIKSLALPPVASSRRYVCLSGSADVHLLPCPMPCTGFTLTIYALSDSLGKTNYR